MWSLASNINFEVWEYGASYTQRCSGLLLAVSGGPYVVLYPGMPGEHVTGIRLPSASHKVLSSSLTFIKGPVQMQALRPLWVMQLGYVLLGLHQAPQWWGAAPCTKELSRASLSGCVPSLGHAFSFPSNIGQQVVQHQDHLSVRLHPYHQVH